MYILIGITYSCVFIRDSYSYESGANKLEPLEYVERQFERLFLCQREGLYRMFSKILIAKRGETVVRIIRASRELAIRAVAIYSEAESQRIHAQDYGIFSPIGDG